MATAVAVAIGMLALPAAPAAAEAAPPAGHGTLQVTLTDRATGAPVGGLTVHVDPVEPIDGWTWISVTTDATGTFSVDVPAGEYQIYSHGELGRYLPAAYPDAFIYYDAEPVTVSDGDTLALTLPMTAPAAAALSVTAGGEPVTAAHAVFWRLEPDGWLTHAAECSTDRNGGCEVNDLMPGAYQVEVSPPWQQDPQWVSGVWPARGETVSLSSGQRVVGSVALPAAARVTGEVRLDVAHATEEVTLYVSAVHPSASGDERGPIDVVSGAPGETVPFALAVEAGRPFRIVLDGFDTEGERYDRIIATEEWTSSGMALLGETVTVPVGETRHFTLDAHLGATLAGTLRVQEGYGTAASDRPASVPTVEQPDRVARHAVAAAASDQPADTGCGGSCGTVVADLYQLRADGWRHFDMIYVGDETAYGVEQPFEFTGLPPATYRLGFWGDHVCGEYWQDSVEFDGATQFEVTADGNAVPIAAQLQSTAGDCSDAGPRELPVPDRLAGDDRFATSVAISQRSFPGTASVVYLASGMNYPDGLAAGPAAAHEGGPVLLTPPDSVPQSVLAEIGRLAPQKIVIVGGTPSVSAQVEAQVRALDPQTQVVRLGGADRFETSRLIAEHAFDSAPAAFLATGLKFPDALTAGPAAALFGGPVLLVNGGLSAPDAATLTTLDGLGIAWVGVAGDPQSVSVGYEEGLMADGFAVERFSGRDRFATAAQIGTLFDGASTVVVASGEGFADALPGAAAAGTIGAPMVLSRSGCMPAFTTTALDLWMPQDVWLLGGEPTLSDAVASYTACQ
ncbi:cell wall-binding repeat-containing protein [Agrococcus sp. HG114]|uniref:cell wall-binding repeat-containing protein n=1 Tax=Agrococcus sp. HG114 TaxID=2969757 RepID=UPI00215B52B6|nr:cell wall-binding repeat-containing protein [Agrococcus sp. HG114]MCR8669864.1 cell wall-binding repeat-containing protein [Agrococcus sp. HG114]